MRKFIAAVLLLVSGASYAQNLPEWTPITVKGIELRCFDFEHGKQLKLFENECQKNASDLESAKKEIEKYKEAIHQLQVATQKLQSAQAQTFSLYYKTEAALEETMKDKAVAESHSVFGGGFYILVIGVLGGAVAGFIAAKKL